MKPFLLILSLLSATLSFAQKSPFRPFKMVIVSPDTIVIDESLKTFTDSIEADHLSAYYRSIKQMEDFLKFKDYPEDMKKDFEETKKHYEENLRLAKEAEPDVKKFKYFQTIPAYSHSVLQMYFNEYPPASTFQVVKPETLKSTVPKEIANSYDVDYVVSYKNIHTEARRNGLMIMKITTTLYSRKRSKIILEKETEGDMNSYGSMWTCSNPLSCLLITCVKSSTTEISEAVAELQKK